MTKFQLSEKLAERSGIVDCSCAKRVIKTLFDTMIQALAKGERIEIRGFGNFTMRTYGSYQGRNPKTGQKVNVEPKKLPFFRVGKDLKERVDR